MADQVLLERDDLISELIDRLNEARDGSGSLVLLAGEAGSGKTSLVKAYIEAAGQRALTLFGACDPLSTPRPLSPLIDFASDENSGLEKLFEDDPDNIEIFDRVLDRVRHTIRPIIMVVEDIHWADQATLDFLRFIGRRIEDSKAVVVCTYRDDEIGPDHLLRPLLGQLSPLASTHRLSVPLLSERAVARLAEGSAVDAAELHRVTGGNPFYVTEVIDGGQELPSSVQDAVVARVARLGRRAREVIEAVSIAPRSLGVDQAMHLVPATTDQVDTAVASGVVLGDGRRLRFRHELARSAVEASLLPARKLMLHRRMIGLLLEDDPPDNSRLAHHAIKAEAPDLIVEYAPKAAREAVSRGATREAVAFYEEALAHKSQLTPDQLASLELELGTELISLDRDAEALPVLESAERRFRASGDRLQQAEALRRLGMALYGLGDTEAFEARNQQALEILEPLGDTENLAMALRSLASQHMLARAPSKGLPIARRAERVAEVTGSPDQTLLSIKHAVACLELVGGDTDRGLELLRNSVEDTREVDPRLHSMALTNLGSGAGEMRRYGVAISALNEGVAHGLKNDLDAQVVYCRGWLARVFFEQGRWDEAVSLAALVDETAHNRASYALLTALGVLGRVRVRRGEGGGLELLHKSLEDFQGHNLQYKWSPACGIAEHHWLANSPSDMVDSIGALYSEALETESRWARGEVGYWMWKAGAIDGPPDNCAEAFALQMTGKWREAADRWRQIGCPYETGLALMESGESEPMLEALAIFDSLNARPIADRLRSQLRSLGLSSIPRGPIPSTRDNPAGLTNRQLEVLELVSQGLSNAAIAERLFVSKKTVEHHISAIYSKLQVNSRAQAIAKAGRFESEPQQ